MDSTFCKMTCGPPKSYTHVPFPEAFPRPNEKSQSDGILADLIFDWAQSGGTAHGVLQAAKKPVPVTAPDPVSAHADRVAERSRESDQVQGFPLLLAKKGAKASALWFNQTDPSCGAKSKLAVRRPPRASNPRKILPAGGKVDREESKSIRERRTSAWIVPVTLY